MALLQYMGVAVGSAVIISFVSLIWPKVTSQHRPKQLTQVRDMVIGTPVGAQAAQVLGVSDETGVKPVNIGTFVTQQANAVVASMEQSAQQAVTSRLLEQLAGKFDQLPKDQKLEFQKRICEPVQ